MKIALALTAAGTAILVAAGAAAQPYPPYGAPPPPPPPGYGAPPPGYGPPGYGAPPPYGAAGQPQRIGAPPEATFFVDDDFRGRGITLNRGINRLGPTGMEDRISSIGIRSGVWLVCEDDYFRGRCVTLDHSIARLSDIGMDDKISSIRPLRPRDRPPARY